MITISINGKDYSFFTSATATKQMDAASGSFSFDAVSTKKINFPIKIGDSCQVFAGDDKVITGFVESLSGSYDAKTHNISISGRDKTADFIDSTIDIITLNAPISLKSIIEKVISHIGANIKVIENIKTEYFKTSEDLISSSIGDNAFDFVQKLARKKQVLITVNGDGNLVIDRSTGNLSNIQIRHQIDSNDNNATSASWTYDNSQRYSKYKAVSQFNMITSNIAGILSSSDLTSQQSKDIIDNAVRSSRQLIFQAENLSGRAASEERVKWEANIRKTRGRIYGCTVPSFYINNIFLKPNLLVRVIDDFAEINDVMLLNSVQYSYGNNGSESLLSFVNKNSYKLSLEEPQNVGNSFFA